MQRTFISNLALLLFLNILVKPFWVFGVEVSIQNVVGAESFGIYNALFSFSLLFNMALDLGINNFNNRNIAQNQHLVKEQFAGIATLKLILGLFYFVLLGFSGLVVGYSGFYIKFLLLLGLNQFLVFFILYIRSNLGGLHLFRSDSIISVLDRLVMIVICSLLLWGNVTGSTFRIEWMVLAQTAAYGITLAVAGAVLLWRTGWIWPKWDLRFSYSVLGKSLPFALLVVLMTFYYRVDAVMIERLLPDGKVQSGIYAQSFRILDALSIISYLYAGLLLPIFARMLKNRQNIEQLVGLSVRLLVVPALAIVAVASVFRVEIIDLLYVAHQSESSAIFGVLMWCFGPIAATYIFGTLLTANGSLKLLNWMAALGVWINIALNFILIPEYGAWGAAVASFATQLLTAVAQIFLAQYLFRFRINYGLLSRMLVFIAALAGMGYMSGLLDMDWKWRLGLMVLASILLAMLLKLIQIRSIFEILKYREESELNQL